MTPPRPAPSGTRTTLSRRFGRLTSSTASRWRFRAGQRPDPLLPERPLRRRRPEAPKTLEELEAAAKKLHKPPSVYGFVARGRKTQAPYTWSHWLYANGGSWLTPDGKPGINSPAGIAAAQQYVRLLRTYGEPGVTDSGPSRCRATSSRAGRP